MRFQLLEPLRGIAALWVFTYHYDFSTEFQASVPWLHAVFKYGHLGVAMFFVISGFCITGSARAALARKEPAWRFLYRRARRIYPTYWYSILVAVGVPYFLASLSAVKTGVFQTPTASDPGAGFLSYSAVDWIEIITLTRVFNSSVAPDVLSDRFTALNAVYWTLAIEVQFYAAVALAVACRKYFTLVFTLLTGISVLTLFIPNFENTGIFLPYWPQFALGFLLYMLLDRGIVVDRLPRPAALLAMCLLVALSVGGYAAYVMMGGKPGSLDFAISFAIAVYGIAALDCQYDTRLLKSPYKAVRLVGKLMVLAGAMSYSIYLIHGRVRFLSMAVVRQIFPGTSIGADVTVIGVTLILCYLFYRICERPFLAVHRKPSQNLSDSDVPVRSA